VGRLAGGVAHDFNNLLTVINGFGEMLLDDLSADDPRRDLVRQITVAGGRAASLTRQLLAFTRRQRIAPEILDLRAVLAETAPMLRRLIGEDVALTVASDADLGSVRADSTQVVQVLLNLAVNARDAMPHGGRLTVEARNAWLDHHPNESHPAGGAGPHVLMAVTDTGCGMTPAVAARAFEPFFTTKEPGKGTGLGLAVVHDIVTWAGGHVEIHSEPGAGTTFRLYFPRAWERPAAGKPQGGPAELPRGDETVLLVEDDDAVRTVASHVLRSCGYRLLEAADGADGLRAAEAHGGRIDLLVADVVLPNMGGPALAERLAAGRPGMRVLFLSGYPEGPVPRDVALGAEAAFLEKPFSPATLARRVREVLERR
jgi:CheY-like chemotaxis protein